MTGGQIQRVVTAGQFTLDGGTWDVENNVWVVGDDREVVVIDAAHDAGAIEAAVAGRKVVRILCTHAHNDHINAVAGLREATKAPVAVHPEDDVLWRMVYPDLQVTLPLIDVFGRGGALKSSWYGDCLPSRDFPMLVDLYRQGRFDLGGFVSETIGIGDIEAAFDKMHRGDVLRSVVVFENGGNEQ